MAARIGPNLFAAPGAARLGLPVLAVFLPISWLLLTRVIFPVRIGRIPGAREMIRRQLAELGPMRRAEWLVLIIFGLTAAAVGTRSKTGAGAAGLGALTGVAAATRSKAGAGAAALGGIVAAGTGGGTIVHRPSIGTVTRPDDGTIHVPRTVYP